MAVKRLVSASLVVASRAAMTPRSMSPTFSLMDASQRPVSSRYSPTICILRSPLKPRRSGWRKKSGARTYIAQILDRVSETIIVSITAVKGGHVEQLNT